MSLPTQCELARLVRETALSAATAPHPPPTSTANPAASSEGPSAMEEEDGNGVEGSMAVSRAEAAAVAAETGVGDGVANGVGKASEAMAWEELLPVESNWHKTVYMLQIIDALLLPAPVRVFFLGRGGSCVFLCSCVFPFFCFACLCVFFSFPGLLSLFMRGWSGERVGDLVVGS